MSLTVRSVTGEALLGILPELARLRMTVFHDWPYLYEGSLEYEQSYLEKFASGAGAICVVAQDGDEIVGASTGAPMVEHAEEFGEPFQQAGYDISKIFYCSESVLLTSHRGHGLGHKFFDYREQQARDLGGFTLSTFCRVVRPNDHPMKPKDYRPLDGFWTKRGYAPVAGIVASYPWLDIGDENETDKPMQFWMKALSS